MRVFAVAIALVLVGCAEPTPNTAEGTDPVLNSNPTGREDKENSTPAGQGGPAGQGADGQTVDPTFRFVGDLAAGQGLWITWLFERPQDGYGYSATASLACGSGLLLLPATLDSTDEGVTISNSFTPFVLVEDLHSRAGGGSSSEPLFLGMVAAFVARTESCLEFEIRVDEERAYQARHVQRFNATWTTYEHSAGAPPFEHSKTLAGWAHVHREPGCDLPVVPAEEQVESQVAFPSGTVEAGVYLNGIFPGPTLDDALYFGALRDPVGTIAIDVLAPTDECVHVVESNLAVAWDDPAPTYADRWWRQEPL